MNERDLETVRNHMLDEPATRQTYAPVLLAWLEVVIKERDEARTLLRWYVENDDTYEGGKWEERNAPWLEKKRAAMKLLGMEEDE